MQSIESEGDTIDQAIDKALRGLGVGRDRVEIEILADATRGLFGFGGKPARVRASVRAPLEPPPRQEAPPVVSRETPNAAPRPVSRETSSVSARAASTPSARERPADRPKPVVSSVVSNVERIAAAAPTRAVIDKSRQVLRELLAHLTVTCEVEVVRSDDPEKITLAVTGDSGGLLIGRRGQTLDAIEHVINRIAGREADGTPSRIVIDVERYRERREEYLDALARRLADKAKHTQRVITLNPMSPRDRRIVHLALQSDPAIETRSQGEGQFRKILILPVDRSRGGTRPKSGQPRAGD
jgi:spoIIIJ-associated protein